MNNRNEDLIVSTSNPNSNYELIEENPKNNKLKLVLKGIAIFLLPTSVSGFGSGLLSSKIKPDIEEIKENFTMVFGIKIIGLFILVCALAGLSQISKPIADFSKSILPAIEQNKILGAIFHCETMLSGVVFSVSNGVSRTIKYIAKCTDDLIKLLTKSIKNKFSNSKEPEIVKTIYHNDNVEIKETSKIETCENKTNKQLTNNMKNEKEELIAFRNELLFNNDEKEKNPMYRN